MPFTLGQKLQAAGEMMYAAIQKARGVSGADSLLEAKRERFHQVTEDDTEREILIHQAEEETLPQIAAQEEQKQAVQDQAMQYMGMEQPWLTQPAQTDLYSQLKPWLPWALAAGTLLMAWRVMR